MSLPSKRFLWIYDLSLEQHSHNDTDIPITTPFYYADELECPDEKIAHIFRSSTDEPIPLLEERIACLREAGQVLEEVSKLLPPQSQTPF